MGSCVGKNKSASTRHKTINSYKTLSDETTARLEPISPTSCYIPEDISQYQSCFEDKSKSFHPILPLETINLLNGWNNSINIEHENVQEIKIYISNNYSEKFSNQFDCKIFKNLRQYCSEHGYDLDVIDLGFSCEYNDDLLNKYHHRHLVKNLIKNTFNSNSHCIFIVLFLDNIDFTTQLLPDIVKSEDFEEILKNLNKDKNEEFTILFNQIYFKSDDCVFQLNLNRNIESRDKINELLESLFKLFKDNLSQDLFQKYCISFLQEEIDTAIEYLDSDSIIWFNTKEFNLKKTTLETSLIDKLQKNVVKDNYAETDLNEFLRLRCRKIIDDLIDQKKTHKIASRIDKNLSYELSNQWESWRVLIKSDQISNQARYIYENLDCKLSQTSTQYPIIIYEQRDLSNFNDNDLLSKIISIYMNKLANNLENSIVYRYCGQTLTSSNAFSLIQSIVHQLAYLFEIHESISFQTIPNLLKSLQKILDYQFNSKRECNHKNIIIIMDRIDRIYGKFNSKYDNDDDFKEIFDYLDKLIKKYAPKLQLIVTFSTPIVKKNRLYEYFESSIDSDSKNTNLIDISLLRKTSQPSKSALKTQRFKEIVKQSYQDFKDLHSHSLIVDYLFDYFMKTRYGLLESEVLDLIYLLAAKIPLNEPKTYSSNINKSNWTCLANEKNTIYASLVIWYSLKYSIHTKIKFISSFVHNGLRYYKISEPYLKRCLKNLILHKDSSQKKIHIKLLKDYFTIKPDSQCYFKVENNFERRLFKRCNFIINNSAVFIHRCYLESPKHLINYHGHYNTDPHLVIIEYSKLFLINFNWFYSKLNANGIWLVLQDFELFKNYCKINQLNSKSDEILMDEVINFETYLTSNLYYLSQSFNLGYFLKNYSLKMTNSQFIIDLKQKITSQQDKLHFYPLKIKKKSSITNELVPLNESITKSTINFACFVKNLENYIVSLSKTQKEIKIWNSQTLAVVRQIKLNKAPKDIRFIDSYKCVLLLDRNLHLFDLNKCEHLVDLQTTMHLNMHFFELPDENNIVFLDRNRLTVTLMKLPHNKIEFQQQNSDTSTNKRYHFKVGEDRSMNSLMVSKNGKIMVCGDEIQKPFPLIVWNLNDQKLIYDFRVKKHEFITSIQAISASGHYLVCGSCEEEDKNHNFLTVYDLCTGTFYANIKEDSNFVCVDISEVHNVIVGSLENAAIILYDISSKDRKYVLRDSKFPCNKIKIIESTHQFFTYDTKGFDWTIRLWDIDRGQLLASYTCSSIITSCDINSRGDTVAVTLYDSNEIHVLKLYSSKNLVIIHASESKKSSLTSTNDLDLAVPIYGDQSLSGKCAEIII